MPSVIENGGNVCSTNKIVSVTKLSNLIGCFWLHESLSTRLSILVEYTAGFDLYGKHDK